MTIRRMRNRDEPDKAAAHLDRVWWEEAEETVRQQLSALTVNVGGAADDHGFFPETAGAACPELVGLIYGDRRETLRTALDLHLVRAIEQAGHD